MKKYGYLVSLFVLLGLGVLSAQPQPQERRLRLTDPTGGATATPTETPTPGATPPWIQYSEKVVGENHPSYDDVVNRPIKYIWNVFNVAHDWSGSHRSPLILNTVGFRDNAGALEYTQDSGTTWLTIQPTPIPTPTPQETPTPQPTATPQPTPTPTTSEALAPVGSILAYAGSSAPTGWLLCQGQAVSRSTYAALYAAIGTVYGTGDGSTTFNLPDLQGRTVIGSGSGSGLTARTLAAKIGEETHTLTIAEIPAHGGHTTDSYAASGGGGYTGSANKGGGGAHNNMQPSLVLSYIIRVY